MYGGFGAEAPQGHPPMRLPLLARTSTRISGVSPFGYHPRTSISSSWRDCCPFRDDAVSSACPSPGSLRRIHSSFNITRGGISISSSDGGDDDVAPVPPPSCYPSADWYRKHPSVVDVTHLADSLRRTVREYTQRESLKLVGILANGGAHRHNSELYSDRIRETFTEDGIGYELWQCTPPPAGGEWETMGGSYGPPSSSAEEGVRRRSSSIQDQIRRANRRDDVHGILIFYPVYPQGPRGPYKCRLTGVYYKSHDDHFRDLVDPTKDVEGLGGTRWLSSLRDRRRDPTLQQPTTRTVHPCTALSVLHIIEKCHMLNSTNGAASLSSSSAFPWTDQTISIVNRSEILGRPLAAMLAQKGATVYSIDAQSILRFLPNGRTHRVGSTVTPSMTTTDHPTTPLQSCLQRSTVVVAGVPDPNFRLPVPSLADGATLVNVSEFPNVCESTLLSDRPDVRYIPHVGKVTVAMLETNLMNLKRGRT
jgi:methylenetetrahydrofolate dehydrogenase (NAD+)